MSLIPGKYQHYKNETIENFFIAVGVPWVGRKIIGMSSPLMEIKKENDEMSVKNFNLFMTLESNFKLDVEYEEKMPKNTLKCKTTLINDHEFETVSTSPSGVTHTRNFSFTEDECVITYFHEKSNSKGKRYFRRVK